MDLEAWLREHHIPVTSEKPYQNGKIYLLESCPFSTAHTGGAYAIQFANGAIHAGCHHHSCGAGKQRWKELREMYETDEERKEIREGRLALGRRERAIAKVADEWAGTGPGPSNKLPAGLYKDRTDPEDPATGEPHEYVLTDAGNAERLIAKFGNRARYCAAFNAWYLWDGKVWKRDDAGKMLLIATIVARSIHYEAANAPQPTGPGRSRALQSSPRACIPENQ